MINNKDKDTSILRTLISKFLSCLPSRSEFADREAHVDQICFEEVAKVVDSSSVSGSICPWISVASCFNGVERSERARQWFPKKSLTPRFGLGEPGGVVGRRFCGSDPRSNEGQSRDIRSADRFTTSKYSLLLFPPCPRTSVQRAS